MEIEELEGFANRFGTVMIDSTLDEIKGE